MSRRTIPAAADLPGLITHASREIRAVQIAYERSQDAETVDNCIRRMEWTIRNLERAESIVTDSVTYDNLVQTCKEMHQFLKGVETTELTRDMGFQAHVEDGRYVITKEALQFLLEIDFKNAEIAEVYNVSRSTIINRLREFGLSHRALYSTMTDAELDEHVVRITKDNKNMGFRFVRSHLLAEGMKVQYMRVLDSLERVDPAGVALRMAKTIQRRKYKVQGPNSFWHFDGNHKLIHWSFVIHGCIDGHSRMIVYLKIAPNNRANSVLEFFQEAVATYGMPSRVRCDQGRENTQVVTWVTTNGGRDRGSVVVGPSTGNQRIERLWRDLFNQHTCRYHDLFKDMEEAEVLNRLSQTQLFALHYTYLPLIQKSLDSFTEAWNLHPLRTAGANNPRKLFVKGILSQVNCPSTGVSRFLDHIRTMDQEEYRLPESNDTDAVPATELLQSHVEVPTNVRCPLNAEQMQRLRERINPVRDSQDGRGLDVYQQVLQYLSDLGM